MRKIIAAVLVFVFSQLCLAQSDNTQGTNGYGVNFYDTQTMQQAMNATMPVAPASDQGEEYGQNDGQSQLTSATQFDVKDTYSLAKSVADDVCRIAGLIFVLLGIVTFDRYRRREEGVTLLQAFSKLTFGLLLFILPNILATNYVINDLDQLSKMKQQTQQG